MSIFVLRHWALRRAAPSAETVCDSISLRERQTWGVKLRAGATVRCERGVLWLTQSRDTRDYRLRAGDRWAARSRGFVVAQAMGASRFCVEELAKR